MNLVGKTIVFTGVLTMTRTDAITMAISAGGKVECSIAEGTDIVVAGSGAGGSKLEAAQSRGVQILTEEEVVAAAAQAED